MGHERGAGGRRSVGDRDLRQAAGRRRPVLRPGLSAPQRRSLAERQPAARACGGGSGSGSAAARVSSARAAGGQGGAFRGKTAQGTVTAVERRQQRRGHGDDHDRQAARRASPPSTPASPRSRSRCWPATCSSSRRPPSRAAAATPRSSCSQNGKTSTQSVVVGQQTQTEAEITSGLSAGQNIVYTRTFTGRFPGPRANGQSGGQGGALRRTAERRLPRRRTNGAAPSGAMSGDFERRMSGSRTTSVDRRATRRSRGPMKKTCVAGGSSIVIVVVVAAAAVAAALLLLDRDKSTRRPLPDIHRGQGDHRSDRAGRLHAGRRPRRHDDLAQRHRQLVEQLEQQRGHHDRDGANGAGLDGHTSRALCCRADDPGQTDRHRGDTADATSTPTPTPTPTLTSFTPTSGAVGSTVTLAGSGLTGTTAVGFNGRAAFFKVVSDTQVTTIVPAGAVVVPSPSRPRAARPSAPHRFTVSRKPGRHTPADPVANRQQPDGGSASGGSAPLPAGAAPSRPRAAAVRRPRAAHLRRAARAVW